MHHSYTHSHLFDLNHSCTDQSRGVRGYGGTSTGLYGGSLPDCTEAATLMKDLDKLVERRSFLMMWTMADALLLRSSAPYWSRFLHSQPDNATCRDNRHTLIYMLMKFIILG